MALEYDNSSYILPLFADNHAVHGQVRKGLKKTKDGASGLVYIIIWLYCGRHFCLYPVQILHYMHPFIWVLMLTRRLRRWPNIKTTLGCICLVYSVV